MRLTAFLVLIFDLFLCTAANAQYKQHQPFSDYYTARAIGNERIYERIQIGIGKHLLTGTANLHYKGPDSSGILVDTNITTHIKSRHSFVILGGTFFPLALLSDNSMLAFNVEFLGSYTDLVFDSVYFHPKALYKKSQGIIMLGVPISLDLKYGGDVALSKVKRQMLTIGGGFFFGGTNSYSNTEKQFPFLPIPFAKAEIGFFAGIAFKLRAVVYFGDAKFIDRPTGNIFAADDVLETKTHSGYGYDISLLIMPFSYGWRTEEWY
jgi:hypothetical protein